MGHPGKVITTCAVVSQSVTDVESGARLGSSRTADQVLRTVERGSPAPRRARREAGREWNYLTLTSMTGRPL